MKHNCDETCLYQRKVNLNALKRLRKNKHLSNHPRNRSGEKPLGGGGVRSSRSIRILCPSYFINIFKGLLHVKEIRTANDR